MLEAIGQGVSIALLVYGGALFFAHRDVLDELPQEPRTSERRIARLSATPVAHFAYDRAASAALVLLITIVAVVY